MTNDSFTIHLPVVAVLSGDGRESDRMVPHWRTSSAPGLQETFPQSTPPTLCLLVSRCR